MRLSPSVHQQRLHQSQPPPCTLRAGCGRQWAVIYESQMGAIRLTAIVSAVKCQLALLCKLGGLNVLLLTPH